MLHHRTTDPTLRSAHITDREVDKEVIKSLCRGQIVNYFSRWLELYNQTLKELTMETNCEDTRT